MVVKSNNIRYLRNMKFYNTLGKKIENFPDKSEPVSLYTCGPTVYDMAHIGNLRTFIFEDLLKRALLYAGFRVNHVMNITDIDDKTIKRSSGEKSKHQQLVEKYEKQFFIDLKDLNISKPETITRASRYIDNMVSLIEVLIKKGYAYKGDDDSIYFDISRFPDYGKLSNINKDELKSNARISQDEYTKDNPADFALWKAWDEKDGEIYWDTALGRGRPGWHIECSTMSQAVFGNTLDIHAGAVDLIFPHHENEIAQSEAATGKPLSKFWVHGEHLLVDGHKMSKSLNNFYTLADIKQHGFNPLDFRYLCLQAHYRSKLNFTWEGLAAARNARVRLVTIAHKLSTINNQLSNKSQNSNSKYLNLFKEKLFYDLNTPESLAVVWEMLRDDNINDGDKYHILYEVDNKILGLNLFMEQKVDIPQEVQILIEERSKARQDKNWQKSDEIRDQVEKLGYILEDTGTVTKITKK